MQRDPDSPATWLSYAKSDLALATLPAPQGVMLEMLCFHAQQAAEKSIKAILIWRAIPFPKTHSVEHLIDLLPADIPRTPDLVASSQLTAYAVIPRYPGFEVPVSEERYRDAVRLAEAVVKWAEETLKPAGTP